MALNEQPELPSFPFVPDSVDNDPRLAELRAEDPVCQVRLPGGGVAWLATRYDDVRTVLSDHRFSREQAIKPEVPALVPGFDPPDTLLNMDPPRHTRIRALMTKAFAARRVERIRPLVVKTVNELLDELETAGPPGDLVEHYVARISMRVICELMGARPVRNVERAEILRPMLDALLNTSLTAAEVEKYLADTRTFIAELIDDKRANPADDVLTDMITAHDRGELTENELNTITIQVISAGYHPVASQLPLSVLVLLRRPDQWAQLREHPALLPNAIEETLRYTSAVACAGMRVTVADVELGGVSIPAGEAVLPALGSANKDAAVFADADSLTFTETAKPAHLALGYGTHFCIGAALAKMELETAVGALVDRFPRLRLAIPESDLEWASNLAVRTIRKLPVTW